MISAQQEANSLFKKKSDNDGKATPLEHPVHFTQVYR